MSRPPPERTPPPPKSIFEYFKCPIEIMQDKVGNLYEYGAKFWISNEIYRELLRENVGYDIEHPPVKIDKPFTLYGIPVVVADHMVGRQCSISGKGWESFNFLIPPKDIIEMAKPDPAITPTTKYPPSEDMGAPYRDSNPFAGIIKILLRFIDWLNGLTGADKHKSKHATEQMATLGELFEGYEESKRKRPPRPGKRPGNMPTTLQSNAIVPIGILSLPTPSQRAAHYEQSKLEAKEAYRESKQQLAKMKEDYKQELERFRTRK